MTEKYNYKNEFGMLSETCHVKKDGTKIGSKKCAECWECRGIDHEENWVKCKKIEKATAQSSPAIE